MLKVLSFILSALFILPNHIEQEFFHLYDFWQHKAYHQQRFGDSFCDFIKKHYFDENSQHEKEHKDAHDKLPFHKTTDQAKVQLVFYMHLQNKCLQHSCKTVMIKQNIFVYNNLYSFLSKIDIIKPPRGLNSIQ